MVPAAGENRVLLAYELVWPALYETPADLLEVLDAVDSPQLGIYFDPANVLRRNVERRQQRDSLATPEQWLGELRDHLKSVHMKDYSEEKGYVDLLAGEVNWKAIRELLDQTSSISAKAAAGCEISGAVVKQDVVDLLGECAGCEEQSQRKDQEMSHGWTSDGAWM